MSSHQGRGGGLLARTELACRLAMRLAAAGRAELAERLLKRVVDRAAAARDWKARQQGCESLARLYLRHARAAEAAVWHQQSVAASLRAESAADPVLAVEVAIATSDSETAAAWRHWELGTSRSHRDPLPAAELVRAARWYAALGDWAAATELAAFAEKAAGASDRDSVRQLRRSLAVLASLEERRTR